MTKYYLKNTKTGYITYYLTAAARAAYIQRTGGAHIITWTCKVF